MAPAGFEVAGSVVAAQRGPGGMAENNSWRKRVAAIHHGRRGDQAVTQPVRPEGDAELLLCPLTEHR